MIPLTRPAPPLELTDAVVAALTTEFVTNQTAVWKQDYIEAALVAMSHCKCAYCEVLISEESKYMEVEHFRAKGDFPLLVVRWDNLLPSCKRCNGKKGTHNVETEGMIIDPTINTPKDHLILSNYRLRGKSELGQTTIDTVYLNDSERLVSSRFEVGERIALGLELTRELVQEYINGATHARRKNRIVGAVEALLAEAQPSSAFSATAATCLLSDPDYLWVKWQFEKLGLWTTQMNEQHISAEEILLA